ncbi:MAG TPA: hydantoinase B/oxoprolinase family protein, partial [Gammaproteobacteria bacterium]|nr:hydantoinase B/oxoprolinase family protein [Gammaproteobacteria bacterium]
MNPIELSLFASRMNAVCEEMGAQLRRAAFSPNIRDRLDFSCAVFDREGELCAQAAHIPVHLGSMAYAMRDIVTGIEWQPGDMVVLNDPFLGGTHLPDVTLIAPVYSGGGLMGFVANRAHHADIGAASPGSMPLSRTLDQEGLIIPPQHIMRGDEVDTALLAGFSDNTRNPRDAEGDFAAQISANRSGLNRLAHLTDNLAADVYRAALAKLNDYAERLARATLNDIPQGRYEFTDYMDDDGLGNRDLPIRAAVTVTADAIEVDFMGTARQVEGNINCPLPVTAAAVFYVFRCLMPAHTPACAGSFRPIRLLAPGQCLLNARRPAAVAAGNV